MYTFIFNAGISDTGGRRTERDSSDALCQKVGLKIEIAVQFAAILVAATTISNLFAKVGGGIHPRQQTRNLFDRKNKSFPQRGFRQEYVATGNRNDILNNNQYSDDGQYANQVWFNRTDLGIEKTMKALMRC